MFFPKELLDNIVYYKVITILTGAGISAESGISTFRDKGGLWDKYRPEDLACQSAFDADPLLVWSWYQYRRDTIARARPNPGHLALVKWEALARDFTLITQNVDGLHRAAGCRRIVELHGNIRINRCQVCGQESNMEETPFDGQVPICSCGGMFRPGVVWFGEMLPENALRVAFQAAEHCDLFITVGTSAVVYPAAALPEVALSRGIPVIEINPEMTPFSKSATHYIQGPAGTVLPELVAVYEKAHGLSSPTDPNS